LEFAGWDPSRSIIDMNAIRAADYIVNLAGENLGDKRWTKSQKEKIVNSRVKSGELLVNALKSNPHHVKSVISSSAIGWYGPDPSISNPKPFKETDPSSDDFLGNTCNAWEQSIRPVENLGIRLVILRTGIVIQKDKGYLGKLKNFLRLGICPISSNGKQMISWIQIDDLVNAYQFAMDHLNMQGIYNAVSPLPVSNNEMMMSIRRSLNSRAIPIHLPAWVLRLRLGEMSIELLKSATVSSKKIEDAGFFFKYPDIKSALS
jgi:uncharacterized protein (TIGR01777 family)